MFLAYAILPSDSNADDAVTCLSWPFIDDLIPLSTQCSLCSEDLYAQVPLGDFPAPALPSLSPQVWKAAFIHSSKNLHAVPRSKFSYSEDFVDNERLEYVGDALL